MRYLLLLLLPNPKKNRCAVRYLLLLLLLEAAFARDRLTTAPLPLLGP